MKKYVKSVLIYCLGFFIMAIGISFSIISNLGVSPVSSIPYVVSEILSVDLGICTTCIFIVYIFLQFLLLGKEFKIINLLQIICASLFGFFVSLAGVLTSPIQIGDNYFLRLIFCGISTILIAIGILLYLSPNLISLPTEGVMQAMCKKFNIPLHKSKIIFDCSVVGLSIVLSFVFLDTLFGVREGTVIAAIFVGVCLKFMQRLFGQTILDFIHR